MWKLSSQFTRKSRKVWEISCWSADQSTDMSVDDPRTLLEKLLSLCITAQKETCFLTLVPVASLLTSWTTSPRITWRRNQLCGCIRIRYYASCTYLFCRDAPCSTQYASPQSGEVSWTLLQFQDSITNQTAANLFLPEHVYTLLISQLNVLLGEQFSRQKCINWHTL